MTELIIDNFAGGGGASTGIELALGRSPDLAINHDRIAVGMHQANHPSTRHFCQDVWSVSPFEVTGGQPIGLAWFSPDCRHFSRAKGGKPASKQVRDLAWVVIKWAGLTNRPRVIILENVEEFRDWGPLDDQGQPCKASKGQTFREFVSTLETLGYTVEHRSLRASDYGTPTIRKRLFLIARCDGAPIVWPQPTHGDPGKASFAESGLKPWRTAAEIIDWSIPCPSIFMGPDEVHAWYDATGQRLKRPLAENTMARTAKGVQKFILDAAEPFIVTTARDAHGLVMPFVTEHANASSQRINPANQPLGTQCANVKGGHFALVAPTLIETGYGERKGQAPRAPGIDRPLGTMVAGGVKHALVSAFMAKHFGGVVGCDIRTPMPTITATGSQQQLVSAFLARHCTGAVGTDMNAPFPTITGSSWAKRPGGNPPLAVVQAFLIKYHRDGGQHADIKHPLSTISTRDRLGLVTVEGADYQINDIGMRMLTPRELFRAQGFPESYVIDRTADGKTLPKHEQVHKCGNSVCPPISAALVRANCQDLALKEAAE